MNHFIILIFILIISGCSAHEAWNGDKKPGVSYVSINQVGKVTSNNMGAQLAANLFMKVLEDGTKEELVEFIEENNKRSTLFIWSSEYNGAMIDSKGNTCLQAASYARSTNSTLDISSSLITVFTQLNLNSDNEKDKLLALNISEAISNLTTSSKQSTYLSAGLFGLCLLNANGGLVDIDLKDALLKLIESSSLSNNVGDAEDKLNIKTSNDMAEETITPKTKSDIK